MYSKEIIMTTSYSLDNRSSLVPRCIAQACGTESPNMCQLIIAQPTRYVCYGSDDLDANAQRGSSVSPLRVTSKKFTTTGSTGNYRPRASQRRKRDTRPRSPQLRFWRTNSRSRLSRGRYLPAHLSEQANKIIVPSSFEQQKQAIAAEI